MKRSWKIGIALAGAFVLALAAGGAALASGHLHEGVRQAARHAPHRRRPRRRRRQRRAARRGARRARPRVRPPSPTTARAERGDLDAALSLWQSDRLDPAAIATLRAHHQAAAKKTGDAVVQALSDAHDALTAAQRRSSPTFLRSHKPPQHGRRQAVHEAHGLRARRRHARPDPRHRRSAHQGARPPSSARSPPSPAASTITRRTSTTAIAAVHRRQDRPGQARRAAGRAPGADAEGRRRRGRRRSPRCTTRSTPASASRWPTFVRSHHSGHGGHGDD